MRKYFIWLILAIIILFLISGGYYIYSTNSFKNTQEDIKQKADIEISYLSTTIISMMNELNNISYENYKITEDTISQEAQNTRK